MARFTLTAQLQLQGASSSNINSALGSMQSQLGKGLTVQIHVNGAQSAGTQLNGLRRQTQAVTTAAEEMGAAFGASLKRFAAFAVATRAVGLFTNKLGDAIDDAINFQHEMVRISQVTGDSLSSLSSLSKQVSFLSTSMGISSKEILGVATTLSQAGLNARDTEIALSALAKTKLAPSFGDIANTTEGAIAILAQFKEGAGALERQLGSVNQVAAKFAVESEDLITVIRSAGGVFKQSGGSLEELLALFTSIRATTRESAESISTGLRTIFTRVQRSDTIYNLHRLGIELQDVEGKFVGPYEATKRLSEALKDLPDGSQKFIAIGEELGGYRNIGKTIPLIKEFALAEKARQVALAGGNSLDKDAASAQQSLALQISKVREEFLALIRDISETSSFKAMVGFTLALTSAFIKVADAIKPLIPLISTFAAIKLTQGIGSFASGIGAGLRRHDGGPIHKFAGGGFVPGSGNGDTVPAMMTPGEFVIKKSSAQSIGADTLHSLNGYAAGGVVSGDRSAYGDIKDNDFGRNITPIKTSGKAFSKLGLSSNLSLYDAINTYKLKRQILNDVYGNDDVTRALGPAKEAPKKKYADKTFGQVHGMSFDTDFGVSFLQPDGVPQQLSANINQVLKAGNATGASILADAIDKRGIAHGAKITANGASVSTLDPNAKHIFDKEITNGLPPLFSRAVSDFTKSSSADVQTKDLLSTSGFGALEGAFFEVFSRRVLGAKVSNPSVDEHFDLLGIPKSQLEILFGKSAKAPHELKNQANPNNIASAIAKGLTLTNPDNIHSITQKSLLPSDPQAAHFGGAIKRFATGGSVDTVPAMLTPGEFVVNKDSAQRLGYGALNKMNKTGVAHFATGGVVGHYADGGGVSGLGVAGGLAIVATLSTALANTTDSTTQFGKLMQSLNTRLIGAGANLLAYSTILKTSNDIQTQLASKYREMVRLTGGVATFQRRVGNARTESANALQEVRVQTSGLSTKQQTDIYTARDIHRDATRDLHTAREKYATTQATDPTNLPALSALSVQIVALEAKMSKAHAIVVKMVPAYDRLDKATENLSTRTEQLANRQRAAANFRQDFGFFQRIGGAFANLSERFATTTAVVSKLGGALALVSAGVQTLAGISEDYFNSQRDAAVKSGDSATAHSASANASFAQGIGGIANATATGITAGAALGPYGALAGGLIGAGVSGFNYFNNKDQIDRDAKDATAKGLIQTNDTRLGNALGSKTLSVGAKSAQSAGALTATASEIKKISNIDDKATATNKFNNDIIAASRALAESARTDEDYAIITRELTNASVDQKDAVRDAIASVKAAKDIQIQLNKIQLDNLKLNSALGAGALAMKNFVAGLETGSSSLTSVVNTLQEAEHNPYISQKAKGALDAGQRAVRADLGVRPGSDQDKILGRVFDRARTGVAFNKGIGSIADFKLTEHSPEQAKTQLLDQLNKQAGGDRDLEAIISKVVHDSTDPVREVPHIISEIQSKVAAELGKGAKQATEIALERERTLTDLTKQRVAAEHEYISIQKHALDLTLEGAQSAHEFGGSLVTGADKARINVEKFNVGNSHLGLQGLRGGSGQDVLSAASEIATKFSKLQNEFQTNGGFRGPSGVDKDKRTDLVAKNKELIETTRSLIASKKEELDLVRKKNQEEKDSLQKLLGGDVEGFLKGQQAAAAGAAIRSGNGSLVSQFSTSALSGALKNAQENGSTPQEVAQVAAVALKSVGIQDQRSAQVLSGTTAEEEKLSREGRGLSNVLGTLGNVSANIESMNVDAANVVIKTADQSFQQGGRNALSQVPISKAHGGMVLHAYQGMFVPRGSDTVPAMLTPGEMVMNTRATGANRNSLEAMNAGGSGGAAGGISSEIATMLSNSLSGFSDAVNKLSNMKISVKLDTTNVNVNFTGGGFLQGMTTQIQDAVMEKVEAKIKSLRQGSDGGFTTDNVKPVLS